jgi:hypothetical protein
MGRKLRVCGQIGVITNAGTDGAIIGPPALMEYAVDPVGLATIKPSLFTLVTHSPSTKICNEIMYGEAPLWKMTSFNGWASNESDITPLR